MSSPSHIRFSTPVQVSPAPFSMDYTTPSLLIGSCFSTSIHERLCADQFPAKCSPFGIVYDAAAMADQLAVLLADNLFTPDDLLFDGELYHSLAHHGCYSGTEAEPVLHRINQALMQTRRDLEHTDLVMLTWASTRSFTHIKTGRRAANNHQLPGRDFMSSYEKLDTLHSKYVNIFQILSRKYPKIKVMITISPVRYLQDGAQANTRSKSTLHLLAEALEKQGAWVFPSFEMLNDELRDYRFYHPDMIHPSSQAVDIIYDRLIDSLFPKENNNLLERIRKINRLLDHRLLHPESPSARQFIAHRLEEVNRLRSDFPHYDGLFREIIQGDLATHPNGASGTPDPD